MKPTLSTFLALIILLLSACKDKTDKLAQQSNPAIKTEKQKQSVNISFSTARPVDTTGYVIYPVYTLNEDEAGSYKRDGIQTYRNLIFYNAATGAYHLLDKKKCLSLPLPASIQMLLHLIRN